MRSQESFSRLHDGYESDQAAKQARDKRYWALRKQGIPVSRFALPNQLKQYDGLGQTNGGICTAYFVQIEEQANG